MPVWYRSSKAFVLFPQSWWDSGTTAPYAGPQQGGQLHERVSVLWVLRGEATGPAEPHSGGFIKLSQA